MSVDDLPSTRDVVRAWLDALRDSDAAALTSLLAPDALFVSPFNRFTKPRHVLAACRARTVAFTTWRVLRVVDAPEFGACIEWQARLSGHAAAPVVSGVELLTITDDAVSRVDVFLRPAEVLPDVHDAMTRAWAG